MINAPSPLQMGLFNFMNTEKKYKLLREVLNATTGHIISVGEIFKQYKDTRKYVSSNGWQMSEDSCLKKDWFEEILEDNKPKELTKDKLGDFVDWVRENRWTKYAEGWCELGGSNGWHCTTDELINRFYDNTSQQKNDLIQGTQKIPEDWVRDFSSMRPEQKETTKQEKLFTLHDAENIFTDSRLTNPTVGFKYNTFLDYMQANYGNIPTTKTFSEPWDNL